MKKEDIIADINYVCRNSSENGGIAAKNFNIHQKKRSSFHVKKGSYIEWSDKDVLIIHLTNLDKVNVESFGGSNFFAVLAGAFLESYVLSDKMNKAIEESRKIKIPWYGIESIGS